MCMKFLEILVKFSKYIQLLMVTWKTGAGKRRRHHWTESWQRLQLCKHGLAGWSCSMKALVGHSTVCSFWFTSPTLWACLGFAVLMASSAQKCVHVLSGIRVSRVSVMGQQLCAHTAAFPPAQKGCCFAKCRARAVSLPSKWDPEESSQQLERAQELLIAVCSQTKLVVHCQVNIAPCISSTAQLRCC